MLKPLRIHYALFSAAIVTIGVGWLVYDYFQNSLLTKATDPTGTVSLAKELGVASLTHTPGDELTSEIKALFSITVYMSQLEQQQLQLRQKFHSADIVERIVLQRELILLNSKIDNSSRYYKNKLNLLIRVYQSLENLADVLPVQENQTAKDALIRGNTGFAYDLLAQLEFKQHNLDERDAVNRAAKAAYLRGKIAEDKMINRKAYWQFRRAVNFAPNNIQYLLAAGNIANEIALYSNAISYYETALYIQKISADFSSKDYREIWTELGVAWNSKGDTDKAIEYFGLALEHDLKTYGPDHLNIAADKDHLGWAWETKGNFKKAVGYYKQALALNQAKLGLAHPTSIRVKENMDAAIRLSTGSSTKK